MAKPATLVDKIPLAEAAKIVRTELHAAKAKIGPFSYREIPSWHDRHRAAMDELSTLLARKVGARITDRWNGARVRINGIVATSTSGVEGALQNWLAAAGKREGRP